MSVTPEIRRQLGVKRSDATPFIYHELAKRNLNATKVAQALGCSISNVTGTIRGTSHSPSVLDALRKAGVPEKYLHDPRCFNGDVMKKSEVA